jgi:Na+/H+-dicarboxylate symporter
MSRFLAIVASLKVIFITASIAFVRGDMLPVILFSVVFNLAQLGAKPINHAVLRDEIVISSDQDDRAG